MASLFRTNLARRSIVASSTIAGPSSYSSSLRFSTSSKKWIADNKNNSNPARNHRPPRQPSLLSKEEVGGGKTQRDVIDSAMGVLDDLARDVASSSTTLSKEEKISTPSEPLPSISPSLTGPIYTTSTLPPRFDPTLEFLTNLLMKDGKKAHAQRIITRTLELISNSTNSNPLPLVKNAIERSAPLVKTQSRKQGGKILQVPVALTKRQSERKALMWIIDASKKRNDRELEKRLASEFLAVVEGTSSAIGRKEEQHKIATVNRANASVRI